MSTSNHVSLLLLLVIIMCFNNSTFGELYFHIINEKPRNVLKRGAPVVFFSNFVPRQAEMTWVRQQPLHATFNLYDPNVEGDNKKIYWSAREDGVYHSLDNVNWNKNTNWST
ncbi:leguminosin group486 secreted peptide [Medicago truncatula]|uniref:Leguminosin group486 secreted peptide n=1 Tax=Medicago truncatula TaxID=3880 RepID=G7IM20_MEDTR|nr:leguminosin group486 secreted peptide [Medicago truncatula]